MLRCSALLIGLAVITISNEALAESQWKRRAGFGVGAAFFNLDDVTQFGLGLSADAQIEHRSGFGIRFVADLTLTDFERTLEWATAGRDVGEFSLKGFGKLTRWIGRGSADDTTVLRAIGGFFGYLFLTGTLIVAGVLYLLSPLGSVTGLDTAVTGAYSMKFGVVTAYAEGGFGHIFYFDPADNTAYSGWGPVAGLGFDVDGIGVGLRAMWSPSSLHSSDDENVIASTATFRLLF